MGKLMDRGTWTDSRDAKPVTVDGPAWKQCSACWRTTLDKSGLCWHCRDKENK